MDRCYGGAVVFLHFSDGVGVYGVDGAFGVFVVCHCQLLEGP